MAVLLFLCCRRFEFEFAERSGHITGGVFLINRPVSGLLLCTVSTRDCFPSTPVHPVNRERPDSGHRQSQHVRPEQTIGYLKVVPFAWDVNLTLCHCSPTRAEFGFFGVIVLTCKQTPCF